MASVRRKGRYYYYRATVYINGKRKYIEHGGFSTYEAALSAGNRDYPLKRVKGQMVITDHLAELVFERFPETSSAHIPLHLMYYYDVDLEEAYSISANDVDYKLKVWRVNNREIYLNNETIKLLRRQEERLLKLQMVLLFDNPNNLYNISLQTGRPVQTSNMWYVQKVIRKTVNPVFHYKSFRKNCNVHNRSKSYGCLKERSTYD